MCWQYGELCKLLKLGAWTLLLLPPWSPAKASLDCGIGMVLAACEPGNPSTRISDLLTFAPAHAVTATWWRVC